MINSFIKLQVLLLTEGDHLTLVKWEFHIFTKIKIKVFNGFNIELYIENDIYYFVNIDFFNFNYSFWNVLLYAYR